MGPVSARRTSGGSTTRMAARTRLPRLRAADRQIRALPIEEPFWRIASNATPYCSAASAACAASSKNAVLRCRISRSQFQFRGSVETDRAQTVRTTLASRACGRNSDTKIRDCGQRRDSIEHRGVLRPARAQHLARSAPRLPNNSMENVLPAFCNSLWLVELFPPPPQDVRASRWRQE